jgi:mycoredoxin
MSEKIVTLYWRPGCGFCSALERQLVKQEIVYEKRNIWDDPEAAAFVRSVARGNETVPTVTVGTASMVNPGIYEVIEAIATKD